MTEDRKLATIRRVKSIEPIQNADRIVLAKIDGWQCVVQKNDFQTGGVGVYFEIDSLLPIEPRYSFLEQYRKKNADGTEGYRLKTIKLKGTLSQGLLMPLSKFPELHNPVLHSDVSEALHIKKYEMPIPAQLAGLVKGAFPPFIAKSDQERVQNLVDKLPEYVNTSFELTEKIDGTSATYYFDGEFGVCSRNLELKESDANTYWRVAKALDIERKLVDYGYKIAIQGEIVGEGIQKNPLKLKGQQFFVFDIYDIEKQRYIEPVDRRIITASLGLNHVPIIEPRWGFGTVTPAVDWLLEFAKGKSQLNPEVEREGLVFKSLFGRTSFKVVNNDYLLEEE